jgi:REP element-mobilizing transposase RayT
VQEQTQIRMQFSQPIAFFFTVTTYGTWLHGDKRGSVNRKGKSLATHYLGPNEKLESIRRAQMIQEALILDAAMRGCVQRAIESFCEFKLWKVLALNVRTNHFHLMTPCHERSEKMLQAIKAAATRALREVNLVGLDRRVWTSGGSARKCFTEEDVASVKEYVVNGQGVDLPMI